MCVYMCMCNTRGVRITFFFFLSSPPLVFSLDVRENHRFLFLSPPFFRGYAVYTNYITMAEAFRLCLRGVISAVIILYVTNYTREREREGIAWISTIIFAKFDLESNTTHVVVGKGRGCYIYITACENRE